MEGLQGKKSGPGGADSSLGDDDEDWDKDFGIDSSSSLQAKPAPLVLKPGVTSSSSISASDEDWDDCFDLDDPSPSLSIVHSSGSGSTPTSLTPSSKSPSQTIIATSPESEKAAERPSRPKATRTLQRTCSLRMHGMTEPPPNSIISAASVVALKAKANTPEKKSDGDSKRSAERSWRLSLPVGTILNMLNDTGSRNKEPESTPVVTGIKANPAQKETGWDDDFAFGDEEDLAGSGIGNGGGGLLSPVVKPTCKLEGIILDDDEDEEDWDAEFNITEKASAQKLDMFNAPKTAAPPVVGGGEPQATDTNAVPKENRMLDSVLSRPVKMLKYPTPPQLYSLKCSNGHSLMHPEEMESWLSDIVAKHISVGNLFELNSPLIADALKMFSEKILECEEFSDDWFKVNARQFRMLLFSGADDEAWQFMVHLFSDIKRFADDVNEKMAQCKDDAVKERTASRLFTLFFLSKYGLHLAVDLITTKRLKEWTEMLESCKKICEPLSQLVSLLHYDYCLDLLMGGDDDTIDEWEKVTPISETVDRLSEMLDSALEDDKKAQGENGERKNLFPLLCVVYNLCSLHLAASCISPLTYAKKEHFPEEEDIAVVFTKHSDLFGTEALREKFLTEVYPLLPSHSSVKARAAFTLAQMSINHSNDWVKAERLSFEALYILDNVAVSHPVLKDFSLVASELGFQCLIQFGQALLHNGKYNYAILCDDAAILICDTMKREEYFKLAQKVAQLCREYNDYARCVRLYSQLVMKYQAAHRTNEAVFTLFLLAELFEDLGSFGEAEDMLYQALDAFRSKKNFHQEMISSSSVTPIVTESYMSSSQQQLQPLPAQPVQQQQSASDADSHVDEDLDDDDEPLTISETIKKNPRTADVIFRLASLLLRSCSYEKGIEILEALKSANVTSSLKLKVLALLSPAYAKKRWFTESMKALQEIASCPAAKSHSGQIILPAEEATAYISPEAKLAMNPSAVSSKTISFRQDAENTLGSLKMLLKCYAYTRHYASSLYIIDYALVFCPETLLITRGKLFYRRGLVLSKLFAQSSSLNFPSALSCIAPEIKNVFNLPTVVPKLVVFSCPTEVLQEAAASFTKAYQCFSTVGDDLRICRTMVALAELYLSHVFVPVAFRGMSYETASTFPLYIDSFSSSGKPSSADAKNVQMTQITTRMIENPAQLALDLSSQFFDVKVQPEALLNMAELRFLQGNKQASQQFWQESCDVFWRFYMAGAHFIPVSGPTFFVIRACRFMERLARMLLCFDNDFIQANIKVLDACLLLQQAADQAGKRPISGSSTNATANTSLPSRTPSGSSRCSPLCPRHESAQMESEFCAQWVDARARAAEEIWSLVMCMKSDSHRFLCGAKNKTEFLEAMRTNLRNVIATADECREAYAKCSEGSGLCDLKTFSERYEQVSHRLIYILMIGDMLLTYTPLVPKDAKPVNVVWLSTKRKSNMQSSSSSASLVSPSSTPAVEPTEPSVDCVFSVKLVDYLISLLHSHSVKLSGQQSNNIGVLSELAMIFRGLMTAVSNSAAATDPSATAPAAAVPVVPKGGRFNSLKGLFASSKDKEKAESWKEQPTDPVVLFCSTPLQVIPWELLVPDVVLLRFSSFESMLQVVRSVKEGELIRSAPQFVCLYNHHREKNVNEERRRELLFTEIQERFLDRTRVAEASSGSSLDGCLQTPLVEETKKSVTIPKKKYKGCLFWDCSDDLEGLWNLVASRTSFPVLLLSYADFYSMPESISAFIARHPLCTVAAVPARDYRNIAQRLFSCAENLGKHHRVKSSSSQHHTTLMNDRYQYLLNIVSSAKIEGVPLVLYNTPLPQPPATDPSSR